MRSTQTKSIGVWMWAIPVLIASLIFWPIWLVLLIGFVVAWITRWLPKVRVSPHRRAEMTVAWIDRHKFGMLASSVGVAILLASIALFVALVEHEREQLNSLVVDLGGYLAIAGVVLGLPALCYAMVTDSAVGRIEDQLGMGKEKIEDIEEEIGNKINGFREQLGRAHFVQVFVPDRQRTRLIPVFDPDQKGPVEGWGINKDAPQAITGSAWVGENYLLGIGSKFKPSKLRLTTEQFKEYEDLKAIAATPIMDRGAPIGVLTVSSSSEDSEVRTKQFRKRHEDTAESLVSIVKNYVPKEGALEQSDLS